MRAIWCRRFGHKTYVVPIYTESPEHSRINVDIKLMFCARCHRSLGGSARFLEAS